MKRECALPVLLKLVARILPFVRVWFVNKHFKRLLNSGVAACLLVFTSLAMVQPQELKAKLAGKRSNIFVIGVGVGGKTRHFIVDTGAAVTVIAADVAKGTTVIKQDGLVSISGNANGAEVFEEFVVGAARIKSHVLVADLDAISTAAETHIDGILGQDIMSQFQSVTFDYKAKVVTFVK
jgi:hypothetical protein